MSSPLITICIPTYNVALYIKETIACWLNQGYQNIEIIIQDDCSTDNTFEIASTLAEKDNRIRLYRNPNNYGIGKNWNTCYEKATGEFVVIFNGDDLIPDNFIDTLLPFLLNDASLDFTSCAFKYWILKQNGTYALEETFSKLPDGQVTNINEMLLTHHPFSHVFTIHRKKSLDKILLPDKSLFILHQVCDYELWMRMGIAGFKGHHTNQIFGKYRKHLTNNSYIHNAEFSGTKEVLKHHLALKRQQKQLYKKWIFLNIYHHLKNCLRNGKKPHFESIFLLFKHYLK
jgi:glycosyltransferase involved in cell wall biosynthesis